MSQSSESKAENFQGRKEAVWEVGGAVEETEETAGETGSPLEVWHR